MKIGKEAPSVDSGGRGVHNKLESMGLGEAYPSSKSADEQRSGDCGSGVTQIALGCEIAGKISSKTHNTTIIRLRARNISGKGYLPSFLCLFQRLISGKGLEEGNAYRQPERRKALLLPN